MQGRTIEDSDIAEWLETVGLKVEIPREKLGPFHVRASPPNGGQVVEIVRREDSTDLISVTSSVGIDRSRVGELHHRLNQIKLELARMNLEYLFSPVENPSVIIVGKLLFREGLTKNEFLNTVQLVKNGALISMLILYT